MNREFVKCLRIRLRIPTNVLYKIEAHTPHEITMEFMRFNVYDRIKLYLQSHVVHSAQKKF